MKKSKILLLSIFISIQVFAQSKLDQTWITGHFGYNVKFQGSSIAHDTTAHLSGKLYCISGHSNICDTNGNLLLVTDGMDIFRGNTDSMIENGEALASPDYYAWSSQFNRYSQGALFLPMDNGIYYLVTPTANDTMLNNQWLTLTNTSFNILNYHKIDMKANGGLGKVIEREKPLLENRFMDKTQMMACRHANGKDWWLFKKSGQKQSDSNFYYTFLFRQDTVLNTGLQMIPFPRNILFPLDLNGQMHFNQQGTQMATIVDNALRELFIADFDRCSGQLSNHKKIIVPPAFGDSSTVGMAYSPSGQFIYIVHENAISQYDLLDPNPNTAWYEVFAKDTSVAQFQGYSCAQLAPNGKLYFGHRHGFSKQMSSIDNPDVKGNGCNFCRKCLRSQSHWGYFSAPPDMPNYNLGASSAPCWPVSINQYDNEPMSQLEVYPNPTSEKFHIKCKNPNSKKELFNSLGQLLLSTQTSEIDASHLPKGLYYLKCEGQVRKVVME